MIFSIFQKIRVFGYSWSTLLVLLSASVERFSVSRMRDFFSAIPLIKISKIYFLLSLPLHSYALLISLLPLISGFPCSLYFYSLSALSTLLLSPDSALSDLSTIMLLLISLLSCFSDFSKLSSLLLSLLPALSTLLLLFSSCSFHRPALLLFLLSLPLCSPALPALSTVIP